MKRIIIRLFYFFKSKSYAKYIAVTIILAAIFVALAFLLQQFFQSNIFEIIIGTAFGFAVSNIAIYLVGSFSRLFEDRLKVNNSTEDMLKIYRDSKYQKIVNFKNRSAVICYNPLLVNVNNDMKIKIKDDPKKNFEVSDFVGENFNTLFNLHASSSIENTETVRLDQIEKVGDKKYIFHLSRSNFYNHLVTNRAVDYEIEHKLSLRTLYEFGPGLKPLEESVFSNHIGINALVFLEDGYVLLPQRKRDSTISKNNVTASIAIALFAPKDNRLVDEDYLFHNSIINGLQKRLSLDVNKIKLDNIEYKFLGIGQNVYEGGKPQMYFKVMIRGVNLNNYQSYLYNYSTLDTKIDNDKVIHVCKYEDIEISSDALSIYINSYDFNKKKFYKKKVDAERSLLCNFWHLEQDMKKNLVYINLSDLLDNPLEKWAKNNLDEPQLKEIMLDLVREKNGELTFNEIVTIFARASHKKENIVIKEIMSLSTIDKAKIAKIKELKNQNIVILTADENINLIKHILKHNGIDYLFDSVFASSELGLSTSEKGFIDKTIQLLNRDFADIDKASI